jgi:hypothetical protein
MNFGGYATILFKDIYRQLMDIVCLKEPGPATIQNPIACKQPNAFFNTLIDMQKFILTEYQIPTPGPDVDRWSRWEVFAYREYPMLVAETE